MFSKIKGFYARIKTDTCEIFSEAFSFINSIRAKFKNLYQTNYNNGMYHLNKGNLWDATFRFKIIQKFWPNELGAQCKYALCLILKEMNDDAERLLNDILKKDPNLREAKDLLAKIKSGKTSEIIKEYNEKLTHSLINSSEKSEVNEKNNKRNSSPIKKNVKK